MYRDHHPFDDPINLQSDLKLWLRYRPLVKNTFGEENKGYTELVKLQADPNRRVCVTGSELTVSKFNCCVDNFTLVIP